MESRTTIKRRAKKARRLNRLSRERKEKQVRLFVILGIISTLFLLVIFDMLRRDYLKKHDDFVTVKSVIIEKKLIPHKLSSWPMIVLEYTYDGKDYSSEHQVSRKNYVKIRVGDTLMIPISVQHGIIDDSRVDILKGRI